MDLQCPTPALEHLLVDEEAHHLHPLRRQSSHWNPNPISNSDPNLRPVTSTSFKRECRRQRREQKRQQKRLHLLENLNALSIQPHPPNLPNPTFSTVEWPCKPITDPKPETTGWGDPAPKPAAAQPCPPASAEEIARIAGLRAQDNGLRVCRDFFAENDGSDDDGDDEMDEDEGESGTLSFFLGLFEKDGELRGFYERNWEKGEFCCLVCRGVGAKLGKRFVDAAGLVQHCSSIYRTKRRGAHRAFGKAVCRVLGWDANCPPSIANAGAVARATNLQDDIQKEDIVIEKESGGPVQTDNWNLMDYLEANDITNLPDENSVRSIDDDKEEPLKEVGPIGHRNGGNGGV